MTPTAMSPVPVGTPAASGQRYRARAAEMARMLTAETDESRAGHGSAAGSKAGPQGNISGVALQVNPAMSLDKSGHDQAATEASAQRTFELLLRVLPHGVPTPSPTPTPTHP